jgi:uncharacterized repeat protein (TIGR03803 family)
VIADSAGNLYGTAARGGNPTCQTSGCGTVFKLRPSGNGVWKETTLYDFSGGADGAGPKGNLLLRRGALFGTTTLGGILVSEGAGTVFQVTP